MSEQPKLLLKDVISEFQILHIPYYVYRSFCQLVGIITPRKIWENIFKKVILCRRINWKKLLQLPNYNPQQSDKHNINDKMIILAVISLAMLVWLKLDINQQSKQLAESKIELFIEPYKGIKGGNSSLLISVQGKQKIDKSEIGKQMGAMILKELKKRDIKLKIIQDRFQLILSSELRYQSIILPSKIQISLSDESPKCSMMFHTDRNSNILAGISLPQQINLMDYCYYFYRWSQFQKSPFLLKVLNKIQTKITEVNQNMEYYFVLNPQNILIVDQTNEEFDVQIDLPKISMISYLKQKLPQNYSNCIYAKQNLNKNHKDCDLWSLSLIILQQCAYHRTYNLFRKQLEKNFQNNVRIFILNELNSIESERECISSELITKINKLLKLETLLPQDKDQQVQINKDKDKKQGLISKISFKVNNNLPNTKQNREVLPSQNIKHLKSSKIFIFDAGDQKKVQQLVIMKSNQQYHLQASAYQNVPETQNLQQELKFDIKNNISQQQQQNIRRRKFQVELEHTLLLNKKILEYLNKQKSNQVKNNKQSTQQMKLKYFCSRVLNLAQIQQKGKQIYEDKDCWSKIGFSSSQTQQAYAFCQLCQKQKILLFNKCKHGACSDCYYSYLEAKIFQKEFDCLNFKISDICCQFYECLCPLTKQIIRTILKDSVNLKKIFQIQLCFQAAKLNLKSVCLCKRNECSSSIIYEILNNTKVLYCIKCKQITCIKCFQIFHGNMSCNDFQKFRPNLYQHRAKLQQEFRKSKQKLTNSTNYEQILLNISLNRDIVSELQNILIQCFSLIWCQNERKYLGQRSALVKNNPPSNFQILISFAHQILLSLYQQVQIDNLSVLFEEPLLSKLFKIQKSLNQLHTAHLGLIYMAYHIESNV